MAKGLLMPHSRHAAGGAAAGRPVVPLRTDLNEYGLIHEPFEYVGYALVIVCVVGRIWCSAYVGGYKNTKLIDTGPFSIVRNPLYVFSSGP
jgi:protein-S-isoprenylcysteine O-methyltransferase Ste14